MVHVWFCCWAVNRLAFIKQYFTSKIRAATVSHSPVQKQTGQIPAQVSLCWAQILRELAGVWGQKPTSQPWHQLLIRLGCSSPCCLHVAKQRLPSAPNLSALPCFSIEPQLVKGTKKATGAEIMNHQTAAQNCGSICTASRKQYEQKQGSQAPTPSPRGW